MTVRARAFARAGLLGNPSDGFFGKTIAISVGNFSAEVFLDETKELKIVESSQDEDVFRSVSSLIHRIRRFGYYGGARLIKAAVCKFAEYCRQQGLNLPDRNFTIRYETTIPRQLGLGGSSAIIVAAMRALMEFYEVDIGDEILPSLILDAERKELGIHAGYMDRVIQVYQGCMYMDLEAHFIERTGHGIYERLDVNLLPPMYLAYKQELGKVSGTALNEIWKGYEKGDAAVLAVLKRLAELADEGKRALLGGDWDKFFALMNENFDLRSKIMTIAPRNRELISTARRCGPSAKFAGSGGAIIGMMKREEEFEILVSELKKIEAEVIRPQIV